MQICHVFGNKTPKSQSKYDREVQSKTVIQLGHKKFTTEGPRAKGKEEESLIPPKEAAVMGLEDMRDTYQETVSMEDSCTECKTGNDWEEEGM